MNDELVFVNDQIIKLEKDIESARNYFSKLKISLENFHDLKTILEKRKQ